MTDLITLNQSIVKEYKGYSYKITYDRVTREFKSEVIVKIKVKEFGKTIEEVISNMQKSIDKFVR